ncbi:MAG: peptidylprolyl isomerase [Deltaproteobacteria bacterium]
MIRITAILICLLGVLPAAQAQSSLNVVAKVNERVITEFELEQRTRFFTLLQAGADTRKQALDRLIEERLQFDVAKRFGITPTDADVLAGMTEFAARGQLKLPDFIKALNGAGVEEQTFRDFVKAGLIWRIVVRGRFGAQVKVTELDIDKALSATAPQKKGVRVLFSEIIMPADTPENRAKALRLADQIQQSPSVGAFSAAARSYSLSGSRDAGGQVPWVDLADMQPALAAIMLTLQPGEISKPFEIPNAVALFQLRAIEDKATYDPIAQTVKYLVYTIPNGQSAEALQEVANLRANSDICPDLYEHAKGLPSERLIEGDSPLADVPSDIALALARLDRGEMTTDLTPAGNLRVVMLCSRNRELPPELTRDSVRESLLNQRLATYGAGYLSELRANANITIYGE